MKTSFLQGWLNFHQISDEIAIVNVDGKERYFDPGEQDCGYGYLAWQHTWVQGIRQTDNGTDFGNTPGEPYTANKVLRVANLTMDEQGKVTGTIKLTFQGAPALHWRQSALHGDEESLKIELRKSLEEMVPKTLEVKVSDIKALSDYEQPLVVAYDVSGTVGTATGKRLLMPADLFVAGSSATFPHEDRENAVYFHYPVTEQDALRINFHGGFEVEAAPDAGKFSVPQRALYNLTVESAPNSFTTRRNYVMGDFLFPKKDYPVLRTFYSQFESKDQESVVLKVLPSASSSTDSSKQEVPRS